MGTIQLTSPGMALGTTGLMPLPVSNGSATAVWEAHTVDPTQAGLIQVPLYSAYAASRPVTQVNFAIPQSVQPDPYLPPIMAAGGAISPPWVPVAVK